MNRVRLYSLLFKAMPSWARYIVYKIRFPNIKINSSVEIYNNGSFLYGKKCLISKQTNIVIQKKGSLVFSDKVYIGRNVEIGSDNIYIGYDTSLQDRCILLGSIKIGSGVIFAPNVFVSSGGHHFEINPYLPIREQDVIGTQTVKHKPVVIEDDCWIGINSVIMPGVTIGKGSVIGAGSIVTKNIPPYSVCVGMPAKVMRNRIYFSEPKELLASEDTCLPYFYSGFRYNIENQKRRVFVSEKVFSFALNFQNVNTVCLSFSNHTKSDIVIMHQSTILAISIGKNDIEINITEEMYVTNKLQLEIQTIVPVEGNLEVLKVQTY